MKRDVIYLYPFSISYSVLMKKHFLLTLLSLVILLNETKAQSDSITLFSPTQLILPASLITIGAWGVNNNWFCTMKNDVRAEMADWRGNCKIQVDDYAQYLPIAAHLGLDFLGIEGKHNFKERIAVSATSILAVTAMVRGVKALSKEERPDSKARNSFPSGHTATAFMGAELVRMEYGNAYGVGAYAIAAGVAFLRVYNDRHWVNDVIAGAGFGVLGAKIGYWLLPLNRKIFKLNGQKQLSILPTYDRYNQSFGIALTYIR